MTGHDAFVKQAVDALSSLGEVRSRAMFGGWGIYCHGVMFAMVAWDRLYLKVDDAIRGRFEEAGSQPFVWDGGNGRPVTMSYWSVPVSDLAEREALLDWARLAVEAAGRSRDKQPKKARKAADAG